jgi:hypothetical protein
MAGGDKVTGSETLDDWADYNEVSAKPSVWPELANPFAEYVVPAFPMDILPEQFRDYCQQKSAQSGFDVGGYAFCLLVAAANTIDHRHRLNLGAFHVPAFLYAGIVGESGSGKSPIINATSAPADEINTALIKESNIQFAEWASTVASLGNKAKSDAPPRPLWKQRHALDTTVEALADLLASNPEGINLFHHEITEFLGRLDAYAGKDGGKDRGVYLRAYDGGQITINRASKPVPLVVDDFSVGILAGVQPEVLAQKFRAAGAGADGLYQRFTLYCLREAGRVNYSAKSEPFVEVNLKRIFDDIHEGTKGKPFTVTLAHSASKLMEDYHNSVRKLGQRTNARRFAEHLDKFPGFLGRICFALHYIQAVATQDDPQKFVTVETMQKAISLMNVLYRHSEAVYFILDRESGQVRDLMQGAAEAILTKRWAIFSRGDLTRNATHWQGAENREAESAIDYLIELGWIMDITPTPIAGKAGRRSAGKFRVNELVHERFADHAERIRKARSERHAAIKKVAGD